MVKTPGMNKIFILTTLLAAGVFALLNKENRMVFISAHRTPQSRTSAHRITASLEEVHAALNAKNAAALGTEGEHGAVFPQFVERMVKLDPAAAVAFLATLDGDARAEYLQRLGQFWVAQDRAAALKWASELSNESERNLALTSVCAEIAQVNPAAAIEAMERFEVPDERSSLENFAQLWADDDLVAATAWASAKPAGPSRDRLLARIATEQSKSEPREAVDLLVKNVTPGETQTEAAISILHQWALRDWDSARQWMEKFPEGPLRERAQNEITGLKSWLDMNAVY
jgi:hypothetical protein